jgi:hypothetical protein
MKNDLDAFRDLLLKTADELRAQRHADEVIEIDEIVDALQAQLDAMPPAAAHKRRDVVRRGLNALERIKRETELN